MRGAYHAPASIDREHYPVADGAQRCVDWRTTKLPSPNAPNGLWDAATFWNSAGQFTNLPGPLPSYATAINEAWTMTGYHRFSGGDGPCAGGPMGARNG
jgi:hypothetical protein